MLYKTIANLLKLELKAQPILTRRLERHFSRWNQTQESGRGTQAKLVSRPPVVAIMGHVNHGKTTLLDSLRKSKIVDQEFGGITQHIGAFVVPFNNDKSGDVDLVIFLDTPGHAAFSSMRKRGANFTDIVVLVIACEDGVRDQTIESINHAKKAQVPIIVAINKIDKYKSPKQLDTVIESIRRQLVVHDVVTEPDGGDVQLVRISAFKGIGVNDLKECILALAETLQLKADINCPVNGRVIEPLVDQHRGKLTTIPVQNGILKNGNYLLGNQNNWSKVKALFDERRHLSQDCGPGMSTRNLTIERGEQDVLKSSGRVVWGAVIINFSNFLAKTFAWFYTGSHSMFSEAIHSLADTANQLILAVGIRKSLQSPTADHPYGYHPMRYIAPLISGVGIFCVGCGLSIYHGLEALLTTQEDHYVTSSWAYGVLLFSLISESTTLFMAIQALRKGALRSDLRVRDYIARNSDPGVIVVLLEDVAAVMGIGIAASCMLLSHYYETHIFDACGSLMIGSLLGIVASFIIKKNTINLVGKSIPRETLNNINRIIEKDVLIRAIHDVKATDLGNGVVRYKAEVDVDGRELTRKYLEKIDLKELLEEIKDIKSEKDAESFVLTHGEGVVDLLGAEVDRIEKELRRNHPKVKHVDLEVL